MGRVWFSRKGYHKRMPQKGAGNSMRFLRLVRRPDYLDRAENWCQFSLVCFL